MIEFKWGKNANHRRAQTYEAIDLDEKYREVFHDARGKRRTVSNGTIAFEVIDRGELYDKLFDDYSREQTRLALAKPVSTVEHLRETVYEEPVAKTANVAPPVTQIDEQAESEQFLDAVTAEETPFIPDPADFFDCVLKSALSGGRDVVGELDNGQWVIINERDFTTKDQGHSLCLKGRQAWVRLELNASAHRHHYLYRATEAQIKVIGSGKERIRGSGTIIVWNASMGAAKMDCGCSIGVGTSSRDEQIDLNSDDRIEFDIAFSEKHQRFLGSNITVIDDRRKDL